MATRMQQRRGTAAQWISTNSGNGPILSAGEIGFESDTNKFKIGDGINHWVDLIYFTDAESITTALNSIIDGAPAALNTLNELAAALGDDANFLSSLATQTYVNTAVGNIDLSTKQDVVSGVSNTEIGYLDGVTSAIQTQLNAKLESSDIAGLATESYVDTAVLNSEVDQSTLAGAGLDWTGTQFAVDTATVFANPTISSGLTLDGTGDFTISADANIILYATTEVYIGSAASGNEVATKAYADAAAAAIVDAAPGTLNTLNELAAAINDDASYAATITTALGNKQDVVSGVSDTEIGYLDGVTSAIQTQLDSKQAVVSGVSNTEIGYLDGVTSNIQTQLDAKASLTMPKNEQTSSYTVVSSDNGKYINITTGGVTVATTTAMSQGQNFVIFNNSGSNQTVTQGSSVTLRLAGTATTGNRTLAQYGIATVICVASDTYVIAGTGLS